MTPHQLAHELEHVYGPELKSVVLYGSAAGRDYSKKYSDFNVFCVLESVTPADLAKANKIVRKWVRKGNPPPHFFQPDYFERSTDVFPLEFMDMKDRHDVLLGSDPLGAIDVGAKNLRHQCESELRGKLIHLQSFYAAHFDKPRQVAEIMIESFPTVLAAMRGILRLMDERPPADARAVVEMIGTRIDLAPQIFFDIIEIRGGNSFLPRGNDALEHFERYLTELGTLTTYVDELELP